MAASLPPPVISLQHLMRAKTFVVNVVAIDAQRHQLLRCMLHKGYRTAQMVLHLWVTQRVSQIR